MVIEIKYSEVDGYSGIILILSEGYYTFTTGDFIKDWFNAIKKCSDLGLDDLSYSESVDQFIKESGLYKRKYLRLKNKEIVFDDKDDIESVQFFIEKDSNLTWDELKIHSKI